jgi:pimeloyl-ACP methyl ester carboxylesterase
LSNRAQLRFDVPGIGGSALPRVPLRMPQLAALVEQLWQHFDITEVDVLGYSWGGALAQELARRNPEAVRKLALMARAARQRLRSRGPYPRGGG